MSIPLRYGSRKIHLNLDINQKTDGPDGDLLQLQTEILQLNRRTSADSMVDSAIADSADADTEDAVELVEKALQHAHPRLETFVRPGATVALVVSDITRPTGSSVYVPILLRELKKLKAGRVTLIIASGLHRDATPTEIEHICGGPLPEDAVVINHSAETNLVAVGQARFNREATEADCVMVTGAVTFHPMAGFSGGRKSLLPGIASAEDIYRNHRLYFTGTQVHPGTGPARVTGNPVLDDIRKRTAGFTRLWALNVVLNEHNAIEFAAGGDVDAVWQQCSRYTEQQHTAVIREPYDAAVASAGGYPSDISFYQSMKVLTNSSRACRPGGTLLIFSECGSGWEIRRELFRYFTMSLDEIARDLLQSFTMDGLALYMALKIIRSYTVWFCSELPAAGIAEAGMHPLAGPEHAAEIIAWERELQQGIGTVQRQPPAYRTAVIPNGSSVLPVIHEFLRGAP